MLTIQFEVWKERISQKILPQRRREKQYEGGQYDPIVERKKGRFLAFSWGEINQFVRTGPIFLTSGEGGYTVSESVTTHTSQGPLAAGGVLTNFYNNVPGRGGGLQYRSWGGSPTTTIMRKRKRKEKGIEG